MAEKPAPPVRSVRSPWVSGVAQKPSMLVADRFIFLNEEGRLTYPDSWNDDARDKLWLYNLHYFDDLNAADAAERVDRHRAFIERWVDENPVGFGNGWEAYPLSLRIVNWVKWALQGNEMEPGWLDSLATQVRFLRKRLEVHLLGNHLFANAKALVFAGLYFSGDEAQEWLGKGLAILAREVPEQVLGDGGHFERSAMYHGIILEDLLDLVNVFGVYGVEENGFRIESGMTGVGSPGMTAVRMLPWMRGMTHPDGGIGFFNDAAFGIAPTFAELDGYAQRLNLGMPDVDSQGLVHLADSGFVRVARGDVVALLDVGEIGPDYLPGHAHADTLSFELSLFGHRCIVNSGISCYGDGAERLRQRGTSAHSTVEIDGENSSEVWGGFRVARRARPLDLSIEESDGDISVTCSHDGYKRLKGKPVHTRQWQFEKGKMVVTDDVQGGFRQAVAYYHLHPDTRVSFVGGAENGEIELDGHTVRWSVLGGKVSIEDSTFHPEFGMSIPNQVIKVMFSGVEAVFTLAWGDRR